MRARITITILMTALMAVPVVGAQGATAVPSGYERVLRQRLAKGVEHLRFATDHPDQTVNVAHVTRSSNLELRAVSSHGRVAGQEPRLERTSSMCARVRCIAAVNGDFFRSDAPAGAVVADGELLRSPNPKHHQAIVTRKGNIKAGTLAWSGRLVATDLSDLTLDGVNVDRGRDQLVLYTGAYGARTQTNPYGVEMVLRFVAPRSGRLPIAETAVVRVESYHHARGNSKIPDGGAILSAHGTAARELGALWNRIKAGKAGREVLLRVETTPRAVTAIGGTPVLLKDGQVWFSDRDTAFVRSRHPRTMVGWNRRGDLWLVTVDGRQAGYASGFTLAEAAAFMRSLGATDAINLDGGGSTTFVVRGEVVNRPSDRAVLRGDTIVRAATRGTRTVNVERPVTNALVLVRPGTEFPPAGPVDLAGAVPEVETLSAPLPSDPDPASDPSSSLPAVVAVAEPVPSGRGLPLTVAGALQLLVVVAWLRINRRRLPV